MNSQKNKENGNIRIKKSYNKRSHDLPELQRGQTVLYEPKKGKSVLRVWTTTDDGLTTEPAYTISSSMSLQVQVS